MPLMQNLGIAFKWMGNKAGVSVNRQWVKGLAIAILVVCLTACGSAPQSIVEEALAYEFVHTDRTDSFLVGHEQLAQLAHVKSIRTNIQRPTKLSDEAGQTYRGFRVEGTYQLEVRSPVDNSKFQRPALPFKLTLARLEEAADDGEKQVSWRLANPIDDATWQLVKFLPDPPVPVEPAPELEPVTENDDSAEVEEPKNVEETIGSETTGTDLEESDAASETVTESDNSVGAEPAIAPEDGDNYDGAMELTDIVNEFNSEANAAKNEATTPANGDASTSEKGPANSEKS